MTTSKQSANTTHRKRLARRLADETGTSYVQALRRVTAAAEAGLLPSPLDPDGMDAAIQILTRTDTDAVAVAGDAADAEPCIVCGKPSVIAVDADVTLHGQAAPAGRGTYRPLRVALCAKHAEEYHGEPQGLLPVHKARPAVGDTHCVVCSQRIKKVPGGQGPTWVHSDSGAVAAPGADTGLPVDILDTVAAQNEQPAEQPEETNKATAEVAEKVMYVAHDGNPVPRCVGSSWRAAPSKKDGTYGPGGYNRCVKAEGHFPDDPHHVDEWGHVFLLVPKFRVVRMISNTEVAQVARDAGMHVSDGSDMKYRPAKNAPMRISDLRENLLVQTPQREVLKVSTIYDNRVTAQVLYPVPPRTTVCTYTAEEVMGWREPTDAMIRKYEKAWGFA